MSEVLAPGLYEQIRSVSLGLQLLSTARPDLNRSPVFVHIVQCVIPGFPVLHVASIFGHGKFGRVFTSPQPSVRVVCLIPDNVMLPVGQFYFFIFYHAGVIYNGE